MKSNQYGMWGNLLSMRTWTTIKLDLNETQGVKNYGCKVIRKKELVSNERENEN